MKKGFKVILATAVIAVFSIQAAHGLSLKLKKEKAKAEEKIAKEVAEIEKKCGCKPAVEINWDSLEKKDDFFIPSRNMSNVADGMARVCKDFKKEVCDGVKTIKISKGPENTKSLKNGVMEMTLQGGDRTWGEQSIQRLIEENL